MAFVEVTSSLASGGRFATGAIGDIAGTANFGVARTGRLTIAVLLVGLLRKWLGGIFSDGAVTAAAGMNFND